MKKADEITNSLKYRIAVPGTKVILVETSTDTILPLGLPVVLRTDLGHKKIETPEGNIYQLLSLVQHNRDCLEALKWTDPKELNDWGWNWTYHQNPYDHRWSLSKIVHEYGSGIVTDWECGPVPCTENKKLFEIILREARSLIGPAEMGDNLDKRKFFNFFVDITLLAFGGFEWGDGDPKEYESFVLNFTWMLHSILSCDAFTPSGTNWFDLDDSVWLSELTPMWDE